MRSRDEKLALLNPISFCVRLRLIKLLHCQTPVITKFRASRVRALSVRFKFEIKQFGSCKRVQSSSAPFAPILILFLQQSLFAKSREVRLVWPCRHRNKCVVPSIQIALPPMLRCTIVVLWRSITLASSLRPAQVKLFLLRLTYENFLLPLRIFVITERAESPRAKSAKFSFLVPSVSWFFTMQSKNLCICCLDALMRKSQHLAMQRASSSYFLIPFIFGT